MRQIIGMFCFLYGAILGTYMVTYLYAYWKHDSWQKKAFAFAIVIGYFLLSFLGAYITLL